MKILAIGASNSTKSINKALATYTAKLVKAKNDNAEVEVLDINKYEIPIYSPEREEADGVPQLAKDFYAKVGEADIIVISYAEHNGNYTAAWKNPFDWTTRHEREVFQNIPMLALATSPGQGGAGSVLGLAKNSAKFFGGNIKGSLSVPSFYDNFDMEKGELTNAELLEALNAQVAKLLG